MRGNINDIMDKIKEILEYSSPNILVPEDKDPITEAIKGLGQIETFIDQMAGEHLKMDLEFEGIAEMIEDVPDEAPREELNELINDIKDIADNNYGKWRDVNNVE